MPQISSSVKDWKIEEINKLVSTDKKKAEFRSFSEAVDELLGEALEARKTSKNAKK